MNAAESQNVPGPPWLRTSLRLLSLLLSVYCVSLLLHRSTHPVVGGRYSLGLVLYIVLIAAITVVTYRASRPASLTRLWRLRHHVVAAVGMTILSVAAVELATRASLAVTQSPFYWV